MIYKESNILFFKTDSGGYFMAENRLIGDYPVIGIRPCIDGRRGPMKLRESLEDQTMALAKAAKIAIIRRYYEKVYLERKE